MRIIIIIINFVVGLDPLHFWINIGCGWVCPVCFVLVVDDLLKQCHYFRQVCVAASPSIALSHAIC